MQSNLVVTHVESRQIREEEQVLCNDVRDMHVAKDGLDNFIGEFDYSDTATTRSVGINSTRVCLL
jgi:hypothetical protein